MDLPRFPSLGVTRFYECFCGLTWRLLWTSAIQINWIDFTSDYTAVYFKPKCLTFLFFPTFHLFMNWLKYRNIELCKQLCCDSTLMFVTLKSSSIYKGTGSWKLPFLLFRNWRFIWLVVETPHLAYISYIVLYF